MMSLAGGDMAQYGLIKKMSVGDYLVKLDNYTKDLERKMEAVKLQNNQTKAKA